MASPEYLHTGERKKKEKKNPSSNSSTVISMKSKPVYSFENATMLLTLHTKITLAILTYFLKVSCYIKFQ
jgi:hypothetical protein